MRLATEKEMVLLSVYKLPLPIMCPAAFKAVAQYFYDPAFSLFHILTYPLWEKTPHKFLICLSPPQFQSMTSCFQISHYLKLLTDINTFLSGSSSTLWGPPFVLPLPRNSPCLISLSSQFICPQPWIIRIAFYHTFLFPSHFQ